MAKEQPQVMRNDPEAAHYRTDIKGWVSRDGRYFGDGPTSEDTARYAGCTHVECKVCGLPTPKGYTVCTACRAEAEVARYNEMPRKEWDGKAWLFSHATDRFYETLDDALDELDLEAGESLFDLRLVLCDPIYAREIESDYYCDDLPEDGDLPTDVEEAMNTYNRAVRGVILSWSPGRYALLA